MHIRTPVSVEDSEPGAIHRVRMEEPIWVSRRSATVEFDSVSLGLSRPTQQDERNRARHFLSLPTARELEETLQQCRCGYSSSMQRDGCKWEDCQVQCVQAFLPPKMRPFDTKQVSSEYMRCGCGRTCGRCVAIKTTSGGL